MHPGALRSDGQREPDCWHRFVAPEPRCRFACSGYPAGCTASAVDHAVETEVYLSNSARSGQPLAYDEIEKMLRQILKLDIM